MEFLTKEGDSPVNF